jgi:hypothetical protein
MRGRTAALGLFALVAFMALVILLEPAEAQQAGKVYVIVWMSPYPLTLAGIDAMAVVRAGLRERGWTGGKDFTIVRQDARGMRDD